jgi:hypothetical protein
MLFPTLMDWSETTPMQIAEVELLYFGEITSPHDAISITLPAGAVDVRGVGSLFDRQLGDINKLEVAPLAGGNTIVEIIPAAGPTVLKSFELIGAADDFIYSQRVPRSVTVAGSLDGTNYTNLGTGSPNLTTGNLQIHEFSSSSNTTAFTHYRITFGPPTRGDRLQVGEMRLFGQIITPALPPRLTIGTSGDNLVVSWPHSAGYQLESTSSLENANWAPVGMAPVLAEGVNTLTLPRNEASGFFRLRR